MRNFMKSTAVFVLVVMLSGCMSLTQSEKNAVFELKSYGVNTCDVKIKSPAVAAWLNVLPGVGYFYLVTDSEEKQLWCMGFLGILTYPLSIAWGVPGAHSDAWVLNEKDQVRFYQYTPAGQEQLKALREKYRTVDLGLREIDSNDGRIRAS